MEAPVDGLLASRDGAAMTPITPRLDPEGANGVIS